jgi:hypothetical protein
LLFRYIVFKVGFNEANPLRKTIDFLFTSTAVTDFAPALAAIRARTPVPVPMSTTRDSGRTTF